MRLTLTLLFLAINASAADVRSNVETYLSLIGVDPSNIRVVGAASDGHAEFAVPTVCRADVIAASLFADKAWLREPSAVSRYFHATPFGYRYRKNPSLNIHVFTSSSSVEHRYGSTIKEFASCGVAYEIDIDRYCFSVLRPKGFIGHLGEIAIHNLFHTSTSEKSHQPRNTAAGQNSSVSSTARIMLLWSRARTLPPANVPL